MLNYYEILEVNENASLDEIKKSFKRLAFKYHPDINPGDELAKEKMVELIEAYDVLSDPISRNWYNLRSDKNAIDQQFEEAYQSYVKNSTERQEAIKRKLQEEREELKTRYQKINGYVSIPILLIIVPVIFFLGLEIFIYLMMSEELVNNASIINLLLFGSMIASFSLFINLLHLQSLYNKYFKPNGNITEENVPIILALSLVFAVVVFIGQPSLVRSFEETEILEEVCVPYEYSDDFIYYKFTYKGVEYAKAKEFSGFRYYRQVDSLHIRFYPSNPNKSDIYGLWSNGMEIFYSHKFFKD